MFTWLLKEQNMVNYGQWWQIMNKVLKKILKGNGGASGALIVIPELWLLTGASRLGPWAYTLSFHGWGAIQEKSYPLWAFHSTVPGHESPFWKGACWGNLALKK